MKLLFYYNVDEDLTLKLLTQHSVTELFNIVEKNRVFLREWLPWIKKRLLEIFEIQLRNGEINTYPILQ